eukprot:CFRG1768T1
MKSYYYLDSSMQRSGLFSRRKLLTVVALLCLIYLVVNRISVPIVMEPTITSDNTPNKSGMVDHSNEIVQNDGSAFPKTYQEPIVDSSQKNTETSTHSQETTKNLLPDGGEEEKKAEEKAGSVEHIDGDDELRNENGLPTSKGSAYDGSPAYDASDIIKKYTGVFSEDSYVPLERPRNDESCDVQLHVDPAKAEYNIEIEKNHICEPTRIIIKRVDGEAVNKAVIGTLKANAMLVPGKTNPGRRDKADSVQRNEVKMRPIHFRSTDDLSAYEAFIALDDSSNEYEVTFPNSAIRLKNPNDAKIIYENKHLTVKQDHDYKFTLGTCKKTAYNYCQRHLVRNVPMSWDYAVYSIGDCERPLQGEKISLTAGDDKKALYMIKPHPEAVFHFGMDVIKTSYFKARLNGATPKDPVMYTRKGLPSRGYVWDADVDAFVFSVEHTVPGNFTLEVELEWYYGLNEIGDPQTPWNMGRYDGASFSVCGQTRAAIGLMRPLATVDIRGPKTFSSRKCDRTDGPDFVGHWITKKEKGCDEECTGKGAFTDEFLGLHNNGAHRSSMFVPDNCRPHIYTDKNILECAQKKKIDWLGVIGDSTIREVAAMLLTKYPPHDSAGRFSTVKMPVFYDLNNKDLGSFTIAFEAPASFIDHCNNAKDNPIDAMTRKWKEEKAMMDDRFNLRLTNENEGRPQVMVVNNAVAYSAWKLTQEKFILFMYQLAGYYMEALAAKREGVQPLRIIWFIPFEYPDRAHEGTINVNSQRILWQSEVAIHILKEVLGDTIEFFSAKHVGEGEWRYTWDGLHALRTGGVRWHGIECNVLMQMLMNVIFDDCTGTDVAIELEAKTI